MILGRIFKPRKYKIVPQDEPRFKDEGKTPQLEVACVTLTTHLLLTIKIPNYAAARQLIHPPFLALLEQAAIRYCHPSWLLSRSHGSRGLWISLMPPVT